MGLVIGIGVALLAQIAQAQADSARWRIETGVEIAAAVAAPAGGAAYGAAQMSGRYGFTHPTTPWGVDLRVGLTDPRFRTHGQVVALAGGITVARRIGAKASNPSIHGTYLLGGMTLTKVAASYDTPAATARGVHVGIGRRIALGTSASLRPELVMTHDFAAHRDSVRAPATTSFALRVGVASLSR